MRLTNRYFLIAIATCLSLALVNTSWAEKRKSKYADAKVVELFSGIKKGTIEVDIIPKNATQATLKFKNKTGEPLRIQLPETVVAVPVLAQFGGGGGGLGGGGLGGGGLGGGGLGGGGLGGGQGIGGGLGGGGLGGGGLGGGGGGGFGGGGGGFFNVAPDAVGKMKFKTVCLEHGKDDPKPRMKYALKSTESFTKDANVVEIMKMLGRGEINQEVAQAASWHHTDGLSWQELIAKVKVQHHNGSREMFFTQRQVMLAMKVSQEATRRADLKKAKDAYEKKHDSDKAEPAELESTTTSVSLSK